MTKKPLKDSGQQTASPRREHTYTTKSVETIKVKTWSQIRGLSLWGEQEMLGVSCEKGNHLAVALENVLQYILIYRGWFIASHPL